MTDPRILELSQQLEYDRTQVADCLSKANKAIDGRYWLTEGRGPYEWNDDNWHKEFFAAAVEIKTALAPLTKIASSWKDCPQTGEEVAQARIDLKARLAFVEDQLRREYPNHMNAILSPSETRLADIDAAIAVVVSARCLAMDLPVYGLLLDLTYHLDRMRSREVA